MADEVLSGHHIVILPRYFNTENRHMCFNEVILHKWNRNTIRILIRPIQLTNSWDSKFNSSNLILFLTVGLYAYWNLVPIILKCHIMPHNDGIIWQWKEIKLFIAFLQACSVERSHKDVFDNWRADTTARDQYQTGLDLFWLLMLKCWHRVRWRAYSHFVWFIYYVTDTFKPFRNHRSKLEIRVSNLILIYIN